MGILCVSQFAHIFTTNYTQNDMEKHRPAAEYTDEELIEKCQNLIIALAKDRSVFRMCVPPQKDDSDILLWELTERLKEK